MNANLFDRGHMSMGLLVLMGILFSSGCAPSGAVGWTRISTPANAPLTSPLPKPTRADGMTPRFEGIYVTPLPNEQVQVGVVTELVAVPQALARHDPRRFTAQVLTRGESLNQTSVIVVHDTQSAREITRLGNDTSQAVWKAMNDEYVIWFCGACQSLKMGLYAYRIATGEQVFISETAGQYPKIDGEWVVYVARVEESHAELRAHNLTTGENILLTQNMATRGTSYQGPDSWGDFFAVRDGRVVWATDLSQPHDPLQWGLQVYDLEKRMTRALNLPEGLGNFSHLGIFGDIVLWRQEFWQGYDLSRDAYFSIPIIPRGWENIQIEKISPVVASEGRLYWTLTVNGKEHYFTAPLTPRN